MLKSRRVGMYALGVCALGMCVKSPSFPLSPPLALPALALPAHTPNAGHVRPPTPQKQGDFPRKGIFGILKITVTGKP